MATIFDTLNSVSNTTTALATARQSIEAAHAANEKTADDLVTDFVGTHLEMGGVFEVLGHGKMELYDFGRYGYRVIWLHFTTENTGILEVRFETLEDLKRQVWR